MKSTKNTTLKPEAPKVTTLNYLCFERHQEYMNKKGFTSCIPEWWALYEGRQTPQDYDEDLPRATENICQWVVDSKHAAILGTTVTTNYTCFDKDISTDALKKFDEYQQKKMKMSEHLDTVLLESEVSAAGFLYHYWSDNHTAMKASKQGSLCLAEIYFEDFFCSNPRSNDIQKQKYIGFKKREEVKAVRARVSKKTKDYEKVIEAIVPDDYYDNYQNYQDSEKIECGMVWVYTRFFRVNGEVFWSASTKYVEVCSPRPLNPSLTEKMLVKKDNNERNGYSPDSDEEYEIDPEIDAFQDDELQEETEEEWAKRHDKMSLYPIELLVINKRRNCLYGCSEIEGVADNQKIINFMISMTAKELQDTAWSTIIAKEGALGGQTWTGKPGGMVVDYTPGSNFGIKRLEGNQGNAQVMNYVTSIIDLTKMITGTNELFSSNSNLKDVTAYALQILEEDRNKKLSILQNRYWNFLVRCAEIRLQFYKHYYPETYYLYELTDAEFSEETQAYNELKNKPDEMITLEDGTQMSAKDALTKKGEPKKVQRRVMKPKDELVGHSFDIVCEPGKGSKYSEIIDMDLINNLFLNGGYEKMSTESFEMWLNLNSFMSESKKADIRVLLEKQKKSELSAYKQQNVQLESMLRSALSRVKQLEALTKQKTLQNQELTRQFNERMGAAKEINNIQGKELQELKSTLPSAEEMAKED